MAHQMETALAVDASIARRLRDAAKQVDAPDRDLASIDRLEAGAGTTADVERLAPLAFACGVSWAELFGGLAWKSKRAL